MWDFKKLASFPNLSPYSRFKLVKFVPNLLRRPLVSVSQQDAEVSVEARQRRERFP